MGMRSLRAFPLIEVMVVVMIISIISMILVPRWLRARTMTQERTCLANQAKLEDAKQVWMQQEGKKTTDAPAMSDLVPAFIREEPKCPTHSTYVLGDGTTLVTCPTHSRP